MRDFRLYCAEIIRRFHAVPQRSYNRSSAVVHLLGPPNPELWLHVTAVMRIAQAIFSQSQLFRGEWLCQCSVSFFLLCVISGIFGTTGLMFT